MSLLVFLILLYTLYLLSAIVAVTLALIFFDTILKR